MLNVLIYHIVQLVLYQHIWYIFSEIHLTLCTQQNVQTRFSVQLAFAKFQSNLKGKCIMNTALPQKFPFILNRNLAKANCAENWVCTSCDTVVFGTQS